LLQINPTQCTSVIYFLPLRTAPRGPRPPHYRKFTITLSFTNHSRYDSSGRVISPTQSRLPDNTQHSQETDIHAPGGIRTQNPSKWKITHSCLRPRGHWVRVSYVSIF